MSKIIWSVMNKRCGQWKWEEWHLGSTDLACNDTFGIFQQVSRKVTLIGRGEELKGQGQRWRATNDHEFSPLICLNLASWWSRGEKQVYFLRILTTHSLHATNHGSIFYQQPCLCFSHQKCPITLSSKNSMNATNMSLTLGWPVQLLERSPFTCKCNSQQLMLFLSWTKPDEQIVSCTIAWSWPPFID